MLIAANQITKFYGQQDLVRKANFHIHMGEKVGLVGPNGSGKSTFVKILMGVVSPDEGEIHRSRHIRIGYLPQDIMLLKGSRILDQVLEVAEEARYIEQEIESIENELAKAEGEEREDLAARLAHCLERFQFLGGYELQSRAEKILTGLGFMREDFERPVETLSGGWAMRVALARLLMSDPVLARRLSCPVVLRYSRHLSRPTLPEPTRRSGHRDPGWRSGLVQRQLRSISGGEVQERESRLGCLQDPTGTDTADRAVY
jgi:ATPase subunit of ABC transporter with duplicated ATPase domains